ncbi:hypothetical protein [uncultured Corynebacterium sp.]|uniref:hypothetical protein n=1 Tax=uncultured Corynebacterium sp. TaxID=159447 RepID=UPI0025F87054|nr:hypothetical protein [uncultured Corynebacterium sp.]
MTEHEESLPAGSAPAYAGHAARLWRIAVYVYLAALVLGLATVFLNWNDMVEAVASGQTGTAAPSDAQARTFVIISVGFATLMQGLAALVCWYLAGKLVEGSFAARMILSVAAVVFTINAVLSVIAMATGANEANSGGGASTFVDSTVTVLIAAATAVAVWATVQAYRGTDNRSFFAST